MVWLNGRFHPYGFEIAGGVRVMKVGVHFHPLPKVLFRTAIELETSKRLGEKLQKMG